MTERDDKLDNLLREWKGRLAADDSRFCPDGIVDPLIWDSIPAGKHILFVLKETNKLDGSLTQWLLAKGRKDFGAIWHRVAEWVQAIEAPLSSYPCFDSETTQNVLRKCAIINLKKIPGRDTANPVELRHHIQSDWDLIARQIELIDPDIIIFGGTWPFVAEAHPQWRSLIDYNKDYAWSCFPDEHAIPSRKRLLIHYWHPSAHFPAIPMYYGVQGIYRTATHEDETAANRGSADIGESSE